MTLPNCRGLCHLFVDPTGGELCSDAACAGIRPDCEPNKERRARVDYFDVDAHVLGGKSLVVPHVCRECIKSRAGRFSAVGQLPVACRGPALPYATRISLLHLFRRKACTDPFPHALHPAGAHNQAVTVCPCTCLSQ